MARQHDAELCERIRQLEERVAELERRPTYWYGGWWQPYWQPQWTWTNATGTATLDTTTITYGADD